MQFTKPSRVSVYTQYCLHGIYFSFQLSLVFYEFWYIKHCLFTVTRLGVSSSRTLSTEFYLVANFNEIVSNMVIVFLGNTI